MRKASPCHDVIMKDHQPLQLPHNEHDWVSNHQRLDCSRNRLFWGQIKENTKALCHWPLWGRGKCFHLMTSSCSQWIPMTLDSDIVSMHRICLPLMLCKGILSGLCKAVEISTGHVSPQCNATRGNPNLVFQQPISKVRCQPIESHVSKLLHWQSCPGKHTT